MRKVVVLSFFLLLAFAFSAYAQPNRDMRGGGAPPSPLFVKACASLSEGTSCSFSDRDGSSISGTCKKKTNPMGKEELVCYNASFFTKMQSQGRREQNRPEQE